MARVRAMTNFTGIRRSPRRARAAVETLSPMEAFQARLRKLGADDELVEAVASDWDEPDDEWLVPRATLLGMSDAQLAELIAQVEAENVQHTTTEADDAAAQDAVAAELAAAFHDLETAAGGQLKVAEVKAWVGVNPEVRARVALAAEQTREAPRTTLVAFLTPLAEAGE